MVVEAARPTSFREHLFKEVPFPVRFLTLALLVGGLIGGIGNFLLLADVWPWNMPPLASRFLAGAAAAYVVGSLAAFSLAGWVASELLLFTVLIYGLALVAAIALQVGLIDWSKPVAWSFVVVVSFALVVCLIYLWSKRNAVAPEPAQALQPLTRRFLIILGLVAGAVGLLVYIVPRQAGLVWPWAGLPVWKELDSRLIASMLLTVAGGAGVTLWRNHRQLLKVYFPMLWAYCVVAGLGVGLHAAATPAFVGPDLIYIGVFLFILLSSAGLAWRERSAV